MLTFSQKKLCSLDTIFMFSDRQKPLYWLMWAYKVHSVALLTNIIKKHYILFIT